MKEITFLLVISFTTIIIPQSENKNKFFSLSISGGASINVLANYHFYRETKDEFLNPGPYVNFGIGYGPFKLVDITELYLSLTASYTKVSTSAVELENYPSEAQLIIEIFPILVWGRLQTDTKLSPFIELGIGTSRLNFIERYSYRLNGASFNYWAFGYGLGAGLNYKISTKIEIALAVDNIANEREHLEMNDRDHYSGIVLRNSVYVYYLRLNINL